MRIHRNPWEYMGTHENTWECMGTHGHIRNNVKFMNPETVRSDGNPLRLKRLRFLAAQIQSCTTTSNAFKSHNAQRASNDCPCGESLSGTLCTPSVPNGRGLPVLVSTSSTSASSIKLSPPGNAAGM